MNSKRKSRDKVATLLVPMFKRRGRAGMIRLGDPFPAKPEPEKPVYRNIIKEALIVKDFLTENPQKTYVDAGQHFNLTRARISQLMKVVHELPPDFIEKMRSCDNQCILKAFSGKTLLKVADFKTEKERRDTIDTVFKRIGERGYKIITSEFHPRCEQAVLPNRSRSLCQQAI